MAYLTGRAGVNGYCNSGLAFLFGRNLRGLFMGSGPEGGDGSSSEGEDADSDLPETTHFGSPIFVLDPKECRIIKVVDSKMGIARDLGVPLVERMLTVPGSVLNAGRKAVGSEAQSPEAREV